MSEKSYRAVAADGGRGRVLIPVPFDPDAVWQAKPRHHITGTVNGMGIRGVIETVGGQRGFLLGPAWLRGCGLAPGDELSVIIAPEGPQRADLPPDLAAALEASPAAGDFFDGLAQFYRRAYLRWIEGTKRRPEVREQRIREVIELLEAGRKERPK